MPKDQVKAKIGDKPKDKPFFGSKQFIDAKKKRLKMIEEAAKR